MKKALLLFLLGFSVAGGLFASLNYHFILTSERLVVERKRELGFENTIVDARGWGPVDYLRHPAVSAALARHGLKQLFDQAGSSTEEAATKTQGALEKGKQALEKGLDKIGEKVGAKR